MNTNNLNRLLDSIRINTAYLSTFILMKPHEAVYDSSGTLITETYIVRNMASAGSSTGVLVNSALAFILCKGTYMRGGSGTSPSYYEQLAATYKDTISPSDSVVDNTEANFTFTIGNNTVVSPMTITITNTSNQAQTINTIQHMSSFCKTDTVPTSAPANNTNILLHEWQFPTTTLQAGESKTLTLHFGEQPQTP